METEDELLDMTVVELRAFLERHGVDLDEIPATGRTPRPLKRDLINRALQLRRDYDALMQKPASYARESPRSNIFQQSAATASVPGHEETTPSAAPAIRALDSDEVEIIASSSFSTPRSSRRHTHDTRGSSRKPRQSTGWIEPGLLDSTHEDVSAVKMENENNETSPRHSSHGVATPSLTRDAKHLSDTFDLGPTVVKVEDEVLEDHDRVGEIGSGSGEEFLSDWSSDDGAPGGQALAVDFSRCRVTELREYLDQHQIPYSYRMRKAELIALCKAQHAINETKRKERRADAGGGATNSARGAAKRGWLRLRRAMPHVSQAHRLLILRITLGVAIALAIAGGVGFAVYRQTRPFCTTDLGGERTEEPSEACRPCPPNGFCVGGDLFCNKGFIKRWNRCVEDPEISMGVATLRGQIVRVLDRAAGQAACGAKVKDALTAEDILRALESKHGEERSTSERFMVAFDRALLNVGSEPQVVVESTPVGENGTELIYRSTNPSYPLACRLRRFVLKHVRAVAIAVLLLALAVYVLIKVRARKQLEQTVDATYRKALLALQEARKAHEDGMAMQPFVVDTHLRDEMLDRERQKRKKYLWALVEKKMSYDTRILKTGPKTLYGVPCYTWEWKAQLPTPRRHAE